MIQELSDTSLRMKETAGQLTDRIQKLTDWLSQLPGHTDAELPIEGGLLRFKMKGKAWEICYLCGDEWKSVTEAPLLIKILTLQNGPTFVKAMVDKHNNLLKQMQTTISAFDQWCESSVKSSSMM